MMRMILLMTLAATTACKSSPARAESLDLWVGQTKWALLARYGEPTETTPHEEGELLCYRIPCGPHDAIPVLWLVGAAVSGGYSGHVALHRPQHVLFHVNEYGVIESYGYD